MIELNRNIQNLTLIAAILIACFAKPAAGQDFAPVSDLPELANVRTDLPGHPQRPNADPAEAPTEYGQITGDWNGLRGDLADTGIEFSATIIADWSSNFQGGLSTNGNNFSHLFDANLTFDLDKILGLQGAIFYVDFYTQEGHESSSNNDVGDFQGFNNLYPADHLQIAEVWYQQEFSDQLAIKIGKMDASADFGYTDNGGDFINSSPGVSPTVLGLVSYPNNAAGIAVFFNPAEDFYTNFGIYDGASNEGVSTGTQGIKTAFTAPADMVLNAEVGKTWDGGRLSLGLWAHTGTFDRFAGGTKDGTEGFYITYDQSLWAEDPTNEDDDQGIAMFAQYGWADKNVSDIDHHLGIGLQWIGPITGRDQDIAGAMASYVHFSNKANATYTDNSETAFELFYKIHITDSFSLQPDLQYITNPGGEGNSDSVVGTIRAVLSF